MVGTKGIGTYRKDPPLPVGIGFVERIEDVVGLSGHVLNLTPSLIYNVFLGDVVAIVIEHRFDGSCPAPLAGMLLVLGRNVEHTGIDPCRTALHPHVVERRTIETCCYFCWV